MAEAFVDNEIKVADPKLSEILASIVKRLDKIEARSTFPQELSWESRQTVVDTECIDLGPATIHKGHRPDVNNRNSVEATSTLSVDIAIQFDTLKDCLNWIHLPNQYKVHHSTVEIQKKSKSALKITFKTMRYAETGLQLLSNICRFPDGYALAEQELFTIFQAQINFLQSEYSTLMVKSTFDEEIRQLFCSFQYNINVFSGWALLYDKQS